jgi:hypothetical protein
MKSYTWAILFFCLSCGQNVKHKEKELAFQFKQEVKLTADSVFINEVLEINNWGLVDSLLLIQSSSTDTIFYLYSLPNLKLVESFGLKGQGPNEYLYPRMSSGQLKQVHIYDNGKRKFQTVQISENGHNLKNERTLNTYKIFNSFGQVEDSLFCMKEETPNHIGLMLYSITSSEPKLLSSFQIKANNKGRSSENDFHVTVNNRNITVAYLHEKKVEFYEINDKNEFQKKNVHSDGQALNPNKFHYTDIVSSDNFVYALYHGVHEYDDFQDISVSTVEVFDKNGKSEAKLKLNKFVNRIIVDNDGKNLYAINPFEADYVYKYNLN